MELFFWVQWNKKKKLQIMGAQQHLRYPYLTKVVTDRDSFSKQYKLQTKVVAAPIMH